MFAGPTKGTPNILNLYLRLSINSTAMRAATNSEPNVDVSTVFWHFEYQMMGALLQKIIIPE
jgi:hypothetical protein